MKKETRKQYDEIVGITLVNLYSLSKNNEAVVFKNFNPYDEEHLYVLSTAVVALSVLNKPIRFNAMPIKRYKFASIIKHPKIEWKKRGKGGIDVKELLEFMRPAAQKIAGDEWFMFSDIYSAYYERKNNEQ